MELKLRTDKKSIEGPTLKTEKGCEGGPCMKLKCVKLSRGNSVRSYI